MVDTYDIKNARSKIELEILIGVASAEYGAPLAEDATYLQQEQLYRDDEENEMADIMLAAHIRYMELTDERRGV